LANTKSAKKRVRVSRTKHEQNRVVRASVKTRVVRVRRLVEGGESEPTAELKTAVASLDRAAERGVLHPNNAARRKSRLMRMVAKAAALAANPEAAAKAAEEAKAHAKGTGKAGTRKGAAKKTTPKTTATAGKKGSK
jgi:small subunit ribosomal protein S20